MQMLYYQLRRVYRDLEQWRADVFYDIEKSKGRTKDLQQELTEIDKALDEYGAKITEIEAKGEVE